MYFEIIGDIEKVETIAVGGRILWPKTRFNSCFVSKMMNAKTLIFASFIAGCLTNEPNVMDFFGLWMSPERTTSTLNPTSRPSGFHPRLRRR